MTSSTTTDAGITPLSPGDESRRMLRVDPTQICYFTYLIASYEGLGVVTTLDASDGLVEVLVGQGMESYLDALIEDLSQEIAIDVVDFAAESKPET